jgi:alpha-beta hydrolase superfamily lysophospholipase
MWDQVATAGYVVFGIDYEGHGESMAARCYIHKFESVVKKHIYSIFNKKTSLN